MANYCFKDSLKRFFSLNKIFIIFILVIFVLGFVTGIFCFAKSNVDLSLSYVQNIPLRNLLLIKTSIIGFAFFEILITLAILIILYLLSFLKIANILYPIMLFYFAYIIGIDCAVIFALCGLKGIFISIITFLAQGLSILILFLYAYKMHLHNKEQCMYGKSSIYGYELKISLFVLAIVAIIIVLESIMLWLLFKIFVF